MTKKEILDAIHGQMIISCQAVEGEPFICRREIYYVSDGARGKTGRNTCNPYQ